MSEEKRERIARWLYDWEDYAPVPRPPYNFEKWEQGAEDLIKLFEELGYTHQPEYEPVELKSLGDEELQKHAISYIDFPETADGELDMSNPKFQKGRIEPKWREISQATCQKNQAKGQLYRIKEEE